MFFSSGCNQFDNDENSTLELKNSFFCFKIINFKVALRIPEFYSADSDYMEETTRAEKARAYFSEGYNCCQSVAMAFSDILDLEPNKVAELTSGFGGGFARMREVCGCVSGMTLVAGALSPADNPQDKEGRTKNYALVQNLAGEFKDRQGSIVCRDLLGLRAGAPQESPVPSDRTPQYYHSRKCADFVACAAKILEKQLKNWTTAPILEG